jgi:hypothetical protein
VPWHKNFIRRLAERDGHLIIIPDLAGILATCGISTKHYLTSLRRNNDKEY